MLKSYHVSIKGVVTVVAESEGQAAQLALSVADSAPQMLFVEYIEDGFQIVAKLHEADR